MEATAPARPQAIPSGPTEKRGRPFASTQGLPDFPGCGQSTYRVVGSPIDPPVQALIVRTITKHRFSNMNGPSTTSTRRISPGAHGGGAGPGPGGGVPPPPVSHPTSEGLPDSHPGGWGSWARAGRGAAGPATIRAISRNAKAPRAIAPMFLYHRDTYVSIPRWFD